MYKVCSFADFFTIPLPIFIYLVSGTNFPLKVRLDAHQIINRVGWKLLVSAAEPKDVNAAKESLPDNDFVGRQLNNRFVLDFAVFLVRRYNNSLDSAFQALVGLVEPLDFFFRLRGEV